MQWFYKVRRIITFIVLSNMPAGHFWFLALPLAVLTTGLVFAVGMIDYLLSGYCMQCTTPTGPKKKSKLTVRTEQKTYSCSSRQSSSHERLYGWTSKGVEEPRLVFDWFTALPCLTVAISKVYRVQSDQDDDHCLESDCDSDTEPVSRRVLLTVGWIEV